MNDFEINILNFIQDTFACPFLDKVMPIITLFGDKGIFWIAVALILIIIKKTRIQIPSLNAGHSSHLYQRFRISQPQIIVIIWTKKSNILLLYLYYHFFIQTSTPKLNL